MSDEAKRILTIISFVAALLIGGLVAAGLGYTNLAYNTVVKSWPTTQGTITKSSARSDIEKMSGRKAKGRMQERSRVSVDYEYSVDGKTYQGNRISPHEFETMSVVAADELVSRYPQGKSQTVYYSESDPSQAFWDPTNDWTTIFLCIAGTVALLSGVA